MTCSEDADWTDTEVSYVSRGTRAHIPEDVYISSRPSVRRFHPQGHPPVFYLFFFLGGRKDALELWEDGVVIYGSVYFLLVLCPWSQKVTGGKKRY